MIRFFYHRAETVYFNIFYGFLTDRKTICLQFNVRPKRRSYRYCTRHWIPNVCIIPTLGCQKLISSSPKSRYALVTRTYFSTNNFLLVNMDYLPSGARCWWHSWLRHWATSGKVTGSILDGVIRIFYWHKPSGGPMALGSTQTLTEMSNRNISREGKDGRCIGLTNLSPLCADPLEIWEPQSPVMGLPYLYLPFQFNVGSLTRHSTVSVSIPTLSKVHNAHCDFIIIHTRVIMDPTQCRYSLKSHSHWSRKRESWRLQSYKSEIINMKHTNT
jgi:hypothetical protein